MKSKYYLYSIAIDVPVNKENPELLWDIPISKIEQVVEKKKLEYYIAPTLMYHDLSAEEINMTFFNLVNGSKSSWFIRQDRLYTKISLPVLLLYDAINNKKIAMAAFKVINGKLQDKATIIWY